MSQGVSEGFWWVDCEGMTASVNPNLQQTKGEAKSWIEQWGMDWVKVYHLDFTANKMTLIKEYRRRTESDEEGIVEYV